jgi:peptidoglycan/xylan/chitin deacetylase (PgdA/CDA1 family)
MMSLDMALSKLLFHAWVKRRGQRHCKIPILMYHSISEDSESRRHPYYHTTTSLRAFELQMECLSRWEYEIIGLDRLLEGVDPPCKKAAVLTFDDGLADFYTGAFPILAKFGNTATVFLISDYVEKSLSFKGRACLDWSRVRELSDRGITFGSHTASHPVLKAIGTRELAMEIRESKRIIEERTGRSVSYFSYPYAYPEENTRFRAILKAELESAGYRGCVTSAVGRVGEGDDRFSLKRIPVSSYDDEALFRAKLEGAYDWIHSIQVWTKRMKR